MLLITGITGHTGKYFLRELITNKYEGQIRCIVRKTSDTTLLDNSGLNFEKVVGDLEDEEFVQKAMRGVDTVMHISGILQTPNVIRAAVKANVERGIFVHTTGIYSKFKSASDEYKKIEHELDKLINQEQVNIKITILRPTMIYGDLCDLNMSKFIKMVDTLRLFPVINHGSCLIQPVNARDLGKAYFQVLGMKKEQSKHEYVLSGKKPISMINAFRLISDNLGKKTIFVSFPLGIGVLIARTLKLCTLGKVDYIERVQRMGEDRSFPHKDAITDFGYNPMTFEEGIKIEVDQYLNIK
ncbi:NAD(P)H-binding protein [Aquibacillus koreensis]|uniref:NAD(P)H-binding protein n=1 Tax=Aquibacillus koreensis TaxID=279446 RepID=A0A9X4AIW3_9BACI|nr:NAD(P)H-binding protein [Aquibacillus koreensis]MCT2534631.1 NAD(P)H-binding protein [Aquibacillus koreensis]MDC3419815.1 NAD(P)H-binding protein [Aquibacillus koreensis]